MNLFSHLCQGAYVGNDVSLKLKRSRIHPSCLRSKSEISHMTIKSPKLLFFPIFTENVFILSDSDLLFHIFLPVHIQYVYSQLHSSDVVRKRVGATYEMFI